MRTGKYIPFLLIGIILVGVILKSYVDQSFDQLKLLNEKLTYLKSKYRQLTGLGLGHNNVVTDHSAIPKCFPKKQVAFAKTHKTGSSTLQNIFFRYGEKNNLNFAMPERSWMFPFKQPFNASMVNKLPWARLGYDMFIFHSIWNYNELKKVIPNAIHVTLLRDPVNCYESNYVYMGLEKIFRMDINKFAKLKAAAYVPRRPTSIIGKNQQLFDLGMNHVDMEQKSEVINKIAELETQLDFVLIAEYFDESLVLLAKLLCWDLADVRYLKQNARKASKVSDISEASRQHLQTWLSSDYKLYNHYVKKLQRLIDDYGRDKMSKDVANLRSLNEDLRKECVLEVSDNSKLKGEFKMALDIVEGYVIDQKKPWCASYARTEMHFTEQLRRKQKSRAGRARDFLLKGLDTLEE